METKLYIPQQKDTPEVKFDFTTGDFSIKGISHPENISVFFNPIMQWVEDMKGQLEHGSIAAPEHIRLTFFFIYVNSASYKYLITVVDRFHAFTKLGIPLSITWCYEPEDFDMRDAGLELKEYLDLDMVAFDTAERVRDNNMDPSV